MKLYLLHYNPMQGSCCSLLILDPKCTWKYSFYPISTITKDKESQTTSCV